MALALPSACSSCRACEAAFDCAAVANTGNRFLLTRRNLWSYDGFAAERRLALLGSCYKKPPLQDIPRQALAQLPTPSPD
ncbi:hypothetical protein KW837_23400 [Pseudomonas sp. PDM24]|nr:hypothetical protein [Pseudomonas sp. PDM24]